MMVVSPEDTVVSCSNGQKTLQTLNFYEKTVHGKKMGWWYPNPYSSQDSDIMITNFNVDAYDFRGCICSESITNQI